MTVDHLELEPREPRPPGHGRIVVAGVLGACALGVGLGLWARPTLPADKTPAPPEPPAAEASRAALQIVIDDEPAPLGEPLEVLPPDPRHHNLAPFGARPEPVAPRRPASGLVKVDAPVAAEPLPIVRLEAPPRVEPAQNPAPRADSPTAPKAPKAEAAREKRPTPKAVKTERRAEARKTRPAEQRASATKAQVVKARVEKAEKAMADKARPQLKKLVKAVKAAPKAIETKAVQAKAKVTTRKDRKVELAEAKPKTKKLPAPKVKATKVKAEKVQVAKARPVAAPTRPKTEPARAQIKKKPAPRGEGPMRVAQAPNRCANVDPGEALVCADGRLGARDRQLQQAYRNAEAAGVPASALRRQQARWLQARAAAAREAPWAVEDVYVARIAELNDLTQDAREN